MPSPTRSLRAVSFDAAGTLFHPVAPIGDLYARVAARHGVHVDGAMLGPRFTRAFAAAPPLAFPPLADPERRACERRWWRDVVCSVFADVPFPAFDAYFDDLFAFFGSAEPWRADPDALPLLRALRARGLRLLLVSNFDARVRNVLAALELAPLLDAVTISSEAGAAKPDPRIFAVALGAAGVAAGDVVHVGDTVREDLAAGRAAGIATVLVGGPAVRAEAGDAPVVDRLGDVAAWLAPRLG